MKKILQISNGLALIVTISINYLSNTGIFNGATMSSISSRYENLFTPAGYAFSIWGLIYLSLLAFVIYQGRSLFNKRDDEEVSLQIGWWFVLSCMANILWVLAWLYDLTGLSVLIMLLLLFSLVKIILNTNMERDDVNLKTAAFVWWPFSLYSGWIAVALIANIAAWLTKINWNAFGIPEVTWTIIMIFIAGAINLFMTWNRNMREFALVGVWALAAIAVSNWDQMSSVAEVAVAVSALLFISSTVHAFRNRKSLPW